MVWRLKVRIRQTITATKRASNFYGRHLSAPQIMSGSFHLKEPFFCRDEFESFIQLLHRTEGIVGSVYEQGGRSQIFEVSGTQLQRFAGGMQWIGEQQEPTNETRVLGREHAPLTSTVRMAAQEHIGPDFIPQQRDSFPQAFPIGCRLRRKGRPGSPLLTKGQIAAQHRDVQSRERFGNGDQQRIPAVRSGAMGQDQAGNRRHFRPVKIAVNSRVENAIRHRHQKSNLYPTPRDNSGESL